MPHGLPAARLSTTAYIARAVLPLTPSPSLPRGEGKGVRGESADSAATRTFLLKHPPDTIDDPHTLALVCNALLAVDPTGRDAVPYLDRLDGLKQTSDNRQLAWWEQSGRTTFYGSGRSGSIETTALAALAFLQSRHNPATANAALRWISEQRDARGAWHSTQATVLALKALLAGADAPAGNGQERRINLALGDVRKSIRIPADQAEVMKLIDLTEHLKPGRQTLTLAEATKTGASYQVTFRYHVPGEGPKKAEPLSIQVAYDRKEVEVGGRLEATAVVANNMAEAAAMVLLDLPIPAGFTLEAAAFERMVAEDRIAKFELRPRSVLVYLRDLPVQGRLELRYAFRAGMPVRVTVPGAQVYEYYNPARQGRGASTEVWVTE